VLLSILVNRVLSPFILSVARIVHAPAVASVRARPASISNSAEVQMLLNIVMAEAKGIDEQ
jgi:hypothetical protein